MSKEGTTLPNHGFTKWDWIPWRKLPEWSVRLPRSSGFGKTTRSFSKEVRTSANGIGIAPSFYTADDHELLNDIYGAGEIGYVNRRAVFRDIGTQAWFDYLAWANPVKHDRPGWFGTGSFEAKSDVLEDTEADFTKLDFEALANLHVHWGTPTAGVPDAKLDAEPGNPNAAVYEIAEVLGPTRLRIKPAAKSSGQASYSIGRRCYGKFSVSNCDFFLLDTRTHRSLHNVDHPDNPKATMLGKQQLNWLKEETGKSKADFLFIVSSVNFMVPHEGAEEETTSRQPSKKTMHGPYLRKGGTYRTLGRTG